MATTTILQCARTRTLTHVRTAESGDPAAMFLWPLDIGIHENLYRYILVFVSGAAASHAAAEVFSVLDEFSFFGTFSRQRNFAETIFFFIQRRKSAGIA